MTVADAKVRSRSWLDVLKHAKGHSTATSVVQSGVHRGWEPDPKLPGDMADLIVMSTVDEKAPPVNPGSAALLDALVQEHLERAADIAPPPPFPPPPLPEPLAADSSPSYATPPEISDEARVAMLQREIEVLLRDTPELEPDAQIASPPLQEVPAPPEEVAAATAVIIEESKHILEPIADSQPMALGVAHTPDVTEQAPPPPPQTPTLLPTPTPSITRAELDILLSENAPAVEALPAFPSATNDAVQGSLVGESESVKKLADAESVVAEELSKLIEKTPLPPVAKAEAAPAASTEGEAEHSLSEAEGVLAEELSKLMAETENPAPVAAVVAPAPSQTPLVAAPPEPEKPPLMTSAEQVAAELRVDEAAARTNAAPAPPPAPAAAPHVPEQDSVQESPAESVAEEAPPVPQTAGWLRRLMGDMALMAAQLIDLPFGWMDELNKNVIGVAAFLLLLGGFIMWILARMTGS